jgi:hypothetical protein
MTSIYLASLAQATSTRQLSAVQQAIRSGLPRSGSMYSAHASCAIRILTSDYFPRQQIRSYELKEIAKILEAAESPAEDQSAVATAQAEGIHVAGERYVVARIEERTIYARSVRFHQAKSRRLRQGKLYGQLTHNPFWGLGPRRCCYCQDHAGDYNCSS